MKTTTRANLHTISILSIGIMIGSFGFGNASADDTTTTTTTAPTIPAGEMISVCINKKSGAIRAATKCTTSERSSSLGGPGPQGPKREEAKAVIEADEKRADVEFGHIKAGNGGLIQFFPEHLEVAKKYRSTTRLLRKE